MSQNLKDSRFHKVSRYSACCVVKSGGGRFGLVTIFMVPLKFTIKFLTLQFGV